MADDIVTRLREYAELEESDLLEAADEIDRLRSICNEAQNFIDHDKNCAYLMGRTRNCSCGFDKMWNRLDEARRG